MTNLRDDLFRRVREAAEAGRGIELSREETATAAELEETGRDLALMERPWIRLEVERRHEAGLYSWHHDPQGWVSAAAAAAAAVDDAAFDAAMEELEWAKGVAKAMEREA